MKIAVPFKYTPRDYQLPLLRALDSGVKRAVCVWHRRSGKDKTLINLMAKKAMERVGTYFYFMPTYSQGRKIIWDGMDKDGFRFLDHFPKALRDGDPNNTDMRVKLRNGSIFQVVGTDNIDSIVGTNPVGCVFSEYSLQDPKGWDFIRPILRENGGWAVFNYTPRGKNHGFSLYQMAKSNPDWFTSLLTVADTGVLTPEDIQAERNAGMDEELIQQEFYCSFDSALQGAYYAKELKIAEAENRITNVPWEPQLPVDTWWDLGIGDSTAIGFTQTANKEIHFIDSYSTSGEGLAYFAKFLKEKPYIYGTHHFPHDVEVRELGTGKSRLEMAQSMGIRPTKVMPKLRIDDGINAARTIFNRCWFDQKKCQPLLESLYHYHKEWDEKRKEFKNHPLHDWSSHFADVFRGFAITYRPPVKKKHIHTESAGWMG